MLAAGIRTPVPLDELENHLREDVEQQMRSGLSAQQAFEGCPANGTRHCTHTNSRKPQRNRN
jgi:hypothetical protein